MTNTAPWKAWNEERKRFLGLEPQGFESDIASLERHISKLQEVAPKDKAGWMDIHALEVINKLKDDLVKANVWARML